MQEEIPFKVPSKHSEFYDHPGIIDNSDIIDEEQTNIILQDPKNSYANICMKKGLSENLNFQLIPSQAFIYLFDIYHCNTDIIRYAIEVNETMYQVEVYLKNISIAVARNGSLETDLMNISRKTTIESLKERYCSLKHIASPTKV